MIKSHQPCDARVTVMNRDFATKANKLQSYKNLGIPEERLAFRKK